MGWLELKVSPNSNFCCPIPLQEHNPWWRAKFENWKYIYQVDVKNSAKFCDEGNSNTAISALVQLTISLPSMQCDSSKKYDTCAKYTFHCSVPIPGHFVTITLSGRSSNQLFLCFVDIWALGECDATCWFQLFDYIKDFYRVNA